MLKIPMLLILLLSLSFAGNFKCNLNPSLLKMVASVERHTKRNVGYQYLISFNNRKDAKTIQQILGKELFLDSRTIDCRNKKLCAKITKYLVQKKHINNLDLGAFQLNYKYHKMNIYKYFSFGESYKKACSILQNLIYKYGYDWKTIARYHSSTPKLNYKYLQLISQNNTRNKNEY